MCELGGFRKSTVKQNEWLGGDNDVVQMIGNSRVRPIITELKQGVVISVRERNLDVQKLCELSKLIGFSLLNGEHSIVDFFHHFLANKLRVRIRKDTR